MKRFGKIRREAAGRTLVGAAVVLLYIFWAGCGDSDRALLIPAGSTGQTDSSASTGLIGDSAGDLTGNPVGGISGSASAPVIYVHVCGAVREPGVVELPEGSRGQEALEAAGGFAEDAAREAVNLAEVLADGMQLYFPTQEEYAGPVVWGESGGKVNINTADAELLCTLPGIGEAKAEAIVSYRNVNGAFKSTEDIMLVPGIKDSAYSKMKDLITAR